LAVELCIKHLGRRPCHGNIHSLREHNKLEIIERSREQKQEHSNIIIIINEYECCNIFKDYFRERDSASLELYVEPVSEVKLRQLKSLQVF
jgi:hypothetical protein